MCIRGAMYQSVYSVNMTEMFVCLYASSACLRAWKPEKAEYMNEYDT
jgi:hypothetical protein